MQNQTYTIHYSAVNPGTDKTDVLFFNHPEDIADYLCSGENQKARRIYVTDTTVAALPPVQKILSHINPDKDIVVTLGAGEPYKTLESVIAIVSAALDAGMNRGDIFTGIGGGVITDMTAFAASIFKRGAKLELIPTTLLAMVDAALGGKTGCDFSSYKNMIGTFFPASKLLCAPSFINSLSETEYRSGLAEVFKTGLLYSREIVEIMENSHPKVVTRSAETAAFLVSECMKAKGAVVEQDLTESGLRMQLNLGHTFAHALETCAGLGTITHGDAVAWGIGRAAEVSKALNKASPSYITTVTSILSQYGWCTQSMHPSVIQSYRTKHEGLSDRQLMKTIALDICAAMKKDKKNSSQTIRLILQQDIGVTSIEEIADQVILSVLD